MHFDEFYTALFSHNTCTLSFYIIIKNMAKKSAESYISLKGNDKAISILQNVIKVMVVLKKGRWSIKTWQDLMISRRKMSCPRPTYKLDVMMGKHGHNVLRLPAYHAELNPIELIWAQVKGAIAKNNTTFTTTDMIPMIKNGFAQMSAQDWKKCCRHVMDIEDKYWE